MKRAHFFTGLLALIVVVGDSGCSDSKPGISVSIAGQFRRTNGANVDLVEANPEPWERVCFLAPMATSKETSRMLGFEWNSDDHTAIRRNDGISVVLYVQGNKVVKYAEHPRNLGDFAGMTGKCVPRERAQFYQAKASQARIAGLYPKGE